MDLSAGYNQTGEKWEFKEKVERGEIRERRKVKSGRVSGKKLERKKEEEKKEVQIEEGNGRSERDEAERKNEGEIKRKS